jgi:hypothetical protein
VSGKYDFINPPDLETRVRNLVNWWRHEARAGDEGSITTMAAMLEKTLHPKG